MEPSSWRDPSSSVSMNLFAAVSALAMIRARSLLTRTRAILELSWESVHSYRKMQRYLERSVSKTGLVSLPVRRHEQARRLQLSELLRKASPVRNDNGTWYRE